MTQYLNNANSKSKSENNNCNNKIGKNMKKSLIVACMLMLLNNNQGSSSYSASAATTVTQIVPPRATVARVRKTDIVSIVTIPTNENPVALLRTNRNKNNQHLSQQVSNEVPMFGRLLLLDESNYASMSMVSTSMSMGLITSDFPSITPSAVPSSSIDVTRTSLPSDLPSYEPSGAPSGIPSQRMNANEPTKHTSNDKVTRTPTSLNDSQDDVSKILTVQPSDPLYNMNKNKDVNNINNGTDKDTKRNAPFFSTPTGTTFIALTVMSVLIVGIFVVRNHASVSSSSASSVSDQRGTIPPTVGGGDGASTIDSQASTMANDSIASV